MAGSPASPMPGRPARGAGQSEPIDRAGAATKILGLLALGDEEAGVIRRNAVDELRRRGMSYGQMAQQLDIARGTVQGTCGVRPAPWYRARPDLRIP